MQISSGEDVDPYVWTEGMPLRVGDRLLLCSDGLSDFVEATAMNEIIARPEPFDACEAQIEKAPRGGRHDNISVGVFVIVNGEGEGEPPRPDRPTWKVEAADLAVDTT